MESTVVLGGGAGGGRADRPAKNEREASESFTSTRTSLYNSQAEATQPSHIIRGLSSHSVDNAMQHSPPQAESELLVHRDHLEHQPMLPKLVKPLETRICATITDAADKLEHAHDINSLPDHYDHYEQELNNTAVYRRVQNRNDREGAQGNTLLRQAPPIRVAPIDSDRQSTSSQESDGENPYGLILQAEVRDGVVEEVKALFDTGCPDNFIYRATLHKLGNVREHPLPKEQVKPYKSAFQGDDEDTAQLVVPKKFVLFQLWNEQINLHANEVDLRILELGEPGDFQIILGRKFLRKHGKEGLLERVRLANENGSGSIAPGNDSVAHLRRIKTSRTKKQEANNRTRDQEQREEDQRLLTEIRASQTASVLPITQLPPQTYRHHNRPQIAYPYADVDAAQQLFQGSVSPLPNSSARSEDGPYGEETVVPQTAEYSDNEMPSRPADCQSEKTNTWQTQSATTSSAQFTQSSRQSTASSMSTAPSLEFIFTPAEGFASKRCTPQGGHYHTSRNSKENY
ncbi:hypothetical protein EG329_001768 [Mollisiaceae sp. DMI_Dod_QoI]|nr:hypothetical protein EG329_001768 [Helotiales sp. DMI_Dod_QoI]